MAPSEHPDRAEQRRDGSSNGSRGRGRGRGRGGASATSPDSIPSGSISKLKAQLRQTRRLLARDDLTPDVRTTSERRLKMLELELGKAELGSREAKMATRYKGLRFFERKKVLRRIKQAKAALVDAPGDVELSEALLQARLDLHYILRYPKTEKYIALYPEGQYIPYSSADAAMASTSKFSSKDAASSRLMLRLSLRQQVLSGALPEAAESGDLGIEGEADVDSVDRRAKRTRSGEDDSGEDQHRSVQKDIPYAQPIAVAPPKKRSKADPLPPPDAVPVVDSVDEANDAVPEKKLTRKEKKDLKDKRRRDKKEAQPLSKPPENAAFGDDDFFES